MSEDEQGQVNVEAVVKMLRSWQGMARRALPETDCDRDNVKEVECRITELKRQLAEARAELEKKQADHNKLWSRFIDAEARESKACSERDALKAQVEELERELARDKDPLDAYITKTVDGVSETHPIRRVIALLEQERDTYKAQVERLVEGLRETKALLAECENQDCLLDANQSEAKLENQCNELTKVLKQIQGATENAYISDLCRATIAKFEKRMKKTCSFCKLRDIEDDANMCVHCEATLNANEMHEQLNKTNKGDKMRDNDTKVNEGDEMDTQNIENDASKIDIEMDKLAGAIEEAHVTVAMLTDRLSTVLSDRNEDEGDPELRSSRAFDLSKLVNRIEMSKESVWELKYKVNDLIERLDV